MFKHYIRKLIFFLPRINLAIFVFVGIALGLLSPGAAFSKDYDYININNPFLKKTPVAITEFKAFNGHAAEIRDGKTAKQMLKDALNYTGYLKAINPVAFLSNPADTGIQLGQINFRDWTGIGAELLITGGIYENNGRVKLELRLFDTFNTKLLVGTAYSGSRSMIRSMIHKFCGEIAYALTGKRGVFNSKIAFVSTVNGKKEIFICDFDGENIKQITSDRSISLSPSWSYDSNWLSYVSYKRGRPEIFIRKLKGKRGAIVNFKGMNISPAWMPGQLKLAATLSKNKDQEIYLLTIKGEIIKRITTSWGIDVSPDFSPDGKKIVFTSKRTGTPQIHIKDIESKRVERLTFNGLNNTSPAWSPDGKKIAYVGIVENKINIYLIDINTGIPIQLTMNQGDNEDPSWSPDGSMITFTSTREGGVQRIFVMNASGSDQRRLLNMRGRQTQPDWSN
ncbi:MAG: Tol-Pal system beta propeller repeat protein TolB [Desulfobacula sp.]|nr:Tol-Pal system beta propeller repeat protein TolB [Desulfobacula sp.]